MKRIKNTLSTTLYNPLPRFLGGGVARNPQAKMSFARKFLANETHFVSCRQAADEMNEPQKFPIFSTKIIIF
jgi:hypothetical protein